MAKWIGKVQMDDGFHTLDVGDSIDVWTVTPAAIRHAALEGRISSGPGVDRRFMPTPAELQVMNDMASEAVNYGRMIDFGLWPNDFIREVGHRAGTLYAEGALGHPFRSPYIILHSWKDDQLPLGKALAAAHPDDPNIGISTCAYLVHPLKPREPGDLCVDFEVTLFEGVSINGVRLLAVGDRALVDGEQTKQTGRYCAHVIPFLARFPEAFSQASVYGDLIRSLGSNRDHADIGRAALNNVCDPVLVALTLLNTRGVIYKTIAANPKLNKARARRGNPPIPPYREVDSASYVTAVMQRVQHIKKPPTGTHASPPMHVRLGHWRHYASGEKSFIRDTLVNASDEMREQFKAGRSHYQFAAGEIVLQDQKTKK